MAKRSAASAPLYGVFFGDTHAGCQLALCPPGGVTLDNGGTYRPSSLQRKMWGMWEEFWAWVETATDGQPYIAVHMGDSLDGCHHGNTATISNNLNDQHRIAYEVLSPVAKRAAAYYHIRGTAAHVGDAAMHEERLAQELGAVPNADGQHARYALYKMIGNAMVEAMHHIGFAGAMHSETVAIHKELTESILEAGRWNRRPPDVVIRGHRHRHVETSIFTANGRAYGTVCPGWQAKTGFAFKVAGARQAEPQFGGVLVHWSDKRQELFVRPWVQSVERGQPE